MDEWNESDEQICFGLNRATDEGSLITLLKKITSPELLTVLVPRLKDAEIDRTVDLFTGLLRNHLNHKEYHRLFLDQTGEDRSE